MEQLEQTQLLPYTNIIKNCHNLGNGETIYMFHLNNLPREASRSIMTRTFNI